MKSRAGKLEKRAPEGAMDFILRESWNITIHHFLHYGTKYEQKSRTEYLYKSLILSWDEDTLLWNLYTESLSSKISRLNWQGFWLIMGLVYSGIAANANVVGFAQWAILSTIIGIPMSLVVLILGREK